MGDATGKKSDAEHMQPPFGSTVCFDDGHEEERERDVLDEIAMAPDGFDQLRLAAIAERHARVGA